MVERVELPFYGEIKQDSTKKSGHTDLDPVIYSDLQTSDVQKDYDPS